jgi:hypothetical protein
VLEPGAMKWGLAAALAALVAVAAHPPSAGTATGSVRVACQGRAFDVYFWPHGHGVRKYGFAARKTPHLQIYKRGSVASRSFLIFLLPASYNYASSCDNTPNPAPTTWGGGPRKTISATRRVRCGFPSGVQIKLLPQGGRNGSGLRILRGGSAKELLRAQIKAKGSTLTFDSRYCKAARVPGVG